MKIPYFNYATIAISLVILLSAFLKKVIRGKSGIWFFIVTITVIFSTVLQIIYVNLDNLALEGAYVSDVALRIFHSGYLFFHVSVSLLYVIYMMSLIDRLDDIKKKKLNLYVLFIPLMLLFIALIVNCFYPFMFSITDHIYKRSVGIVITYAVTVYYMLYGLGYIIYSKKIFTAKWIVTLILPYPLILAAAISEYFFPYIILEHLSIVLGILLVYSNIQRPEEIMDPVTGLKNDITFTKDIDKAFLNERRFTILALNILNYDTIKANTTWEENQLILSYVSKLMNKIHKEMEIKDEEYYIRHGQYRIIMENTDEEKITEFAEKIKTGLEEKNKLPYPDFAYVIYIIHCPEEITTLEQLRYFEFSPSALKKNDIYYSSTLLTDKDFSIEFNMDSIIDKALTNHEFMVYYQPIYNVEKKCFESAEALLRLKTDKYGFIDPDVLCRAAEKNGTIHRIGEEVLNEVVKFICSDEFEETGLKYIEINLSLAQCMKEGFAMTIIETLEKYRITPDKINLEIAETAFEKQNSIFMENLRLLKEYGFTFSLDAFGAGYSNIHRLALLPLSAIKIDKNLTSGYENDKVIYIIKDIVQTSKELNLSTVVEGVETKNQLDTFLALNSTYIQGYYFSLPLPKDEFLDFLKNAA